jgi:hypothetical protein
LQTEDILKVRSAAIFIKVDKVVADLFNRPLHDVSHDRDWASLAYPDGSCNSLFLN